MKNPRINKFIRKIEISLRNHTSKIENKQYSESSKKSLICLKKFSCTLVQHISPTLASKMPVLTKKQPLKPEYIDLLKCYLLMRAPSPSPKKVPKNCDLKHKMQKKGSRYLVSKVVVVIFKVPTKESRILHKDPGNLIKDKMNKQLK